MTDATLQQPPLKKPLGVFGLVMINIIAIDNLRTLPFSAELGFSLIGYYILATLCFLVPVALVATELATTWPNRGGIYVWVREAFGPLWGFFVIWLQWVYNVVWYPTALAFITVTLAQITHPGLAHHPWWTYGCVVGLFWFATLVNCFGMRISGAISTLGALLGTLIPMGIIILLGSIWWHQGRPLAMTIGWQQVWPHFSNHQTLPFFVAILFGLVGLEMSAIHADDVAQPERAFPRAMLWSIAIIFGTLVCASLAIAMVVPHKTLNVIGGISQAIDIFLKQYHLQAWVPIMNGLIILGGMGGIAAWIIGPTKGLMIAAQDGCFSPKLAKTNAHGVPARLLCIQAVLVSILSLFYIWMPSVESAYILLTAMTSQMALMGYIALFAAALVLRYRQHQRHRPFQVPGGAWGLWLTCGVGLITCVVVIGIGFVPPGDAHAYGAVSHYVLSLLVGMLVLIAPVFWLYHHQQGATA